METYEMDTIKIEKEKAMQRYITFRKIANIVKTVEIFVAVMLISVTISWTSSFLPTAVEFFSAFVRQVSSLLFSPHFVFIVGNVIIITLFANYSTGNSGESLPENAGISDSSPENARINCYDDNVDLDGNVIADATPAAAAEIEKPEEVEEEREKVYRRTQSEIKMEVVVVKEKETEKEELRRSKTEPRRKSENMVAIKAAAEERRRRRMCEEDELSNEEFRRKVEQFIEKQQRFLREESKSVVLSNYYQRSHSM